MLFLKIAIIVVAVLLVLCLLIGLGTMFFVIYPKRPTYEESEQIEKSKGFWGDYDSYEKEEWNITADDGYLLHGVLIKNNSKKFVIVTHGYMYNRLGSIKYANIFYKQGYNVFLYDLRHFGQNKKCFCAMGRYEPGDIITIQKALFERFGDEITIGLHGESLGCASSILALGKSQRFSFVVADCGFYELRPLLKDQAKKMLHLPSFMEYFTDFWMLLIHHYAFAKIKPIQALENNAVPILFFHGAADEFIIPEHSKKAYEKCTSYKELYIVDKARHAESYFVDPKGYEEKVVAFLMRL